MHDYCYFSDFPLKLQVYSRRIDVLFYYLKEFGSRTIFLPQVHIPDGLVVRIRRSHRLGRGSIPRLGEPFFTMVKF